MSDFSIHKEMNITGSALAPNMIIKEIEYHCENEKANNPTKPIIDPPTYILPWWVIFAAEAINTAPTSAPNPSAASSKPIRAGPTLRISLAITGTNC